MSKNKTIKEVSLEIEAGGVPRMLIGEFIDDFNHACREEKERLTADVPVILAREHLRVYLAAVVDHLCHRDQVRVPEWTADFSLKSPKFYGGDALKAVLLLESPVAFRRRNLFVSSNAVMRV